MKKTIISLLAALLLSIPAAAQYTAITATNIQDATGAKLAKGQICFTGTDPGGDPISYRLGITGQVVSTPVCKSIAAGALVGTFQVADTSITSPANICFRAYVKDLSSNQVVIGSNAAGTRTGYECLQPTGSTFSFDNYSPMIGPFTALVGPTVTGNLAVIGTMNVTGALSVGAFLADHTVFGGGTAPKQVSGGPEMISLQSSNQNRVAIAAFVGSEANARFLLDMKGNLEWGPGGAGDQDVLLYHAFTGMMAMAGLPGGGLEILQEPTYGTFEAQARIILHNDGSGILFTDGTSAADTQIYRAYAGGFDLSGTSGGGLNIVRWTAPFTNEAYPRISLVNDGSGIKFGSGAAAPDVAISYPTTGLLNIAANSSGGMGLLITGDNFARAFLGNDGKGLTFGGGAGARGAEG